MHQRAETITTHTTVGILNYKSTIHNTPVMSAPGAVVQWQLPQRGVHLTPFTPHLHPPVMSPRPCRGGRTRLSIHKKLYECHIVNQSICYLCEILTCKFMQRWPTVQGELARLHKITVPIIVCTLCCSLAC